jgi:hypothetical protein
MAIRTITELPAALVGAIDDTIVFPIDDSDAETRKLTLAQLRTALGDLAIAGDATGSGDPFGTITVTIANGVVTLEKLASVATAHLLGRASAGTGPVQAVSIGPGLTFTGGVLNTAAAQAASDAAPLHDHRAFGGL